MELREAHAFLSTATESNQVLFSAPTPFLQAKFPASEIPLAKRTIRTLYSHKDDLSPETARRAALLGFAIEDYKTASSFADESLTRAPRDPGLLMARGLAEYGSGSYSSATLNFQEASKLTPKVDADTDFSAALNTNLGLSLGQLGAVTHNQAEYETALKHLQEATAQYANLGRQNQAAANNLSEAEILVTAGKYTDARVAIGRASSIFEQLGDENGLAEAEIARGRLILKEASSQFLQSNDPNRAASAAASAREHLERALAISQHTGYRLGVADAKNAICVFWTITGTEDELENGVRNCEEAAAIYDQIGNRTGKANALGNLGNVFRNQKQYKRAITSLDESLAIDREIGFELGTGRQLYNLGRCYFELGDRKKAKELVLAAQEIFRKVGASYELIGAEKFLKDLKET